MKFCARPYQIDADRAIAAEFARGIKATAVVHATGLGKTVLGCLAIQRYAPERTLVLAHRETLVSQFRDEIEEQTGIPSDIEMGALRSETNLWGKKQVVVGSVQTQFAAGGKRMFPPSDFGLLILDEMHHYVGAKKFREVVEHYRQNPRLKIVGLTATPNRTDQKALGQVFETVAHSFEIIAARDEGWLVGVHAKFTPVEGLDYSHIDTNCGELNGRQLDAILEDERIEMEMIQPTVEIAWGLPKHTLHNYDVSEWKRVLDSAGEPKRTLIFCKSVKQADTFANILNRVHPGLAAMICGESSDEHKALVKRDFRGGPLKFVTSVDVLSEGYNNPYLQMLVMARPLKSELRYKQQMGRGTRTWPDILERETSPGVIGFLVTAEERKAAIAASPKPILVVVDFVGNTGEHKIQNCVDALGGEMDDDVVERATAKAKTDGRPVEELLKLSAEEIEKEREERRRVEEARKIKLVGKANYAVVDVNPFDTLDTFYKRAQKWSGYRQTRPLTEKQRGILSKNGHNPDAVSPQEGQAIITKLFRASDKQVAVLVRAGYPQAEVSILQKWQAAKLIDGVAKNGWKRPKEAMTT